ncbi:MAG: alkaline phosphatase [Cyclobacteriaceae bacterium]|nr:MAG: alkaline phosphatase [Cyclobacteriaceae bacterium]
MKPILLVTSFICSLILACSEPDKLADDFPEDSRLLLAAGELTDQSIILQCRLNTTDTLVNKDLQGQSGSGFFQVSTDSLFAKSINTEQLNADRSNDFILRKLISGLNPDQTYFYRLIASYQDSDQQYSSKVGSFTTFPSASESRPVTFAISTGFNYEKFYGIDKPATEVASLEDQLLGFEAFETVRKLQPDFFIANGDVVYYDQPSNQDSEYYARSRPEMRAKWHRYFSMPRNREMMLKVPVYYLKDDHDYRYNDCDTTDQRALPTHQDGVEVFRKQTPVVDLENPEGRTYRTHRMGKLLQLWFVEGRDYRSPNLMEDGPGKTLWGKEQIAWLKKTLSESDAVFKLLISPTPMIGPDDAYKKDNHANLGGFQYEGQAFFSWLKENDFLNKNFYIVCGDRHWQYHSVHPEGFEEFSSGAFVDQNSRAGRVPGDPKSTDPDAFVTVPYIQTEGKNSGGFLQVTVRNTENPPEIQFSFHDTHGNELYSISKTALSL